MAPKLEVKGSGTKAAAAKPAPAKQSAAKPSVAKSSNSAGKKSGAGAGTGGTGTKGGGVKAPSVTKPKAAGGSGVKGRKGSVGTESAESAEDSTVRVADEVKVENAVLDGGGTEEAGAEEQRSVEGKAMVKYNHYKASFHVDAKGRMKWADIDEEYCISYVFPGDFIPTLTVTVCPSAPESQGNRLSRDADGLFLGLEGDGVYELSVAEDPKTAEASAAASKAAAARAAARRAEEEDPLKNKKAVDDITQQLKNLKAEDRTG